MLESNSNDQLHLEDKCILILIHMCMVNCDGEQVGSTHSTSVWLSDLLLRVWFTTGMAVFLWLTQRRRGSDGGGRL